MSDWFFLKAGQYRHFRFDAETASLVTTFIWAIAAGIALAALFTLYQKYVPGALIRAILRAGADSEESARSLEELGFARNPFIRLELKHGTLLGKHLRFVLPGKGQGSGEEGALQTRCPTPNAARFYIPEELKYRADARYDKKGNGPVQCAVTILLAGAIALVVIRLLPVLLSFVDAIL